jgi:putative FmdB family regulatory protein
LVLALEWLSIRKATDMPLFEYECRACGKTFEMLVNGSTTPACPSCHGEDLNRLLSVFAVATRDGGPRREAGPGPCGACGDPRGPGACSIH